VGFGTSFFQYKKAVEISARALEPPLPMPFIIQTPALKGALDCFMIIEHCGDCEHHSASLWHDEDRYKSQADACLKAVAEVFTYLNMYIYMYIFLCL
jgi:hypothetical protein